MDLWLTNTIRQIIIYMLPVLISMTLVCLMESKYTHKAVPHAFFAISWRGTWLPFLASIALMRGMIIALPQAINTQCYATFIRFLTHLVLCLLGFLLYTWALAHQAPTGLPPIHLWWAKILMFFNLCMLAIHLLPLPGLFMGELIFLYAPTYPQKLYRLLQTPKTYVFAITLLAASPILDISIGSYIVFPVYEQLCTLATLL